MTKSRLHVEYISDDMDDDLGICSEDLYRDTDTGVIITCCGSSVVAPGRRTPELIKVLCENF